jgi:phospholipid/cholesterol/gamma-HCH transport system substrate-binding protein
MDTTTQNSKLGLFVIAGLSFIVLMLYLIGSSRNIFTSNFEISAAFNNVNGLMVGNNVRLSGIDVGTVRRIEMENDTSVRVVMIIEKRMRKFIRKNSIASVGTDGLMGNKLVNINFVYGESRPIQAGDILSSLKPIESDEMLRTLNTTNNNLARITNDMRLITAKLNNSKSLWSILQDTVVAENLKSVISNTNRASGNVEKSAQDLYVLMHKTTQGKGFLGNLFADSSVSEKFLATISGIENTINHLEHTSETIEQLTNQVNSSTGALTLILRDTIFRNDLRETMSNARSASERLNEDASAIRENFLFRRYFRKKQAKRN